MMIAVRALSGQEDLLLAIFTHSILHSVCLGAANRLGGGFQGPVRTKG